MTASDETAEHRKLRQFGFIMAAMVVLFFGVLIPWIWDLRQTATPWIVAAVFAAVGLMVPIALKPVWFVWMKVGAILGWINTRIILALIFYLLFLPLGLIMRVSYDPMRRKFDASEESYFQPSKQPVAGNLKKPY